MSLSLKPVAEQVIVITGASSGIGLATARKAAAKGARVVIASRNEDALRTIQDEINQAGGQAVYVVADVGKKEDVRRIADKAIESFGGFDTWVNNAGIGISGRLEDISDEDSRRLFDTNFWGLVYGSLAAAEHLKVKGGAIINLGSMVSDQTVPLLGIYAASKHAIKAFTDTLRMELEEEKSPISVTLIKPSAMGTPFFEHSKNYTGKELKAPSPVYSVEDAARVIVHAAAHSVRDVYVGGQGRIMHTIFAHAPRLLDKYSERFMFKAQLTDKPANLNDPNNLHQAGDDGRTVGKNVGHPMPSLYTNARIHPALTSTVAATLGFAAVAFLNRDTAKEYYKKTKKAVSRR